MAEGVTYSDEPTVPGPEEVLLAIEDYLERAPNVVFYRGMFHQALNDLIVYPTTHRLHQEAYTWFFKERGATDWCSFNSLCVYLGRDCDKLRFLVNQCFDKRSVRARTQILPIECDRMLDMAGCVHG